jgi:ATP:ADP antiporter, AAA family
VNEALLSRLHKVVVVRPNEVQALSWSFAYFFFLLASYYVLRPLRDEMGIAGGVKNLQWLFLATFLVMLAAVPLFGAVVAKLPRRRFIPLVYHFFVANIAIFWLLLTFGVARQEIARVFFVWISVFNLFAVSVFWSFMADLYSSEQGKRLFGFIAAGGSAGVLVGPALTIALAKALGPVNLLLLAAALLEMAVLCAHRLESATAGAGDVEASGAQVGSANPPADKGLGGGWLAGLAMVVRSPYLVGIALWVVLLSLAATVLYFQQANIVAAASNDPAVRTRIFAMIELLIGALTILVQCFATGRLIARFGVGRAAALLPLVFIAGFLALASTPALLVVIVFQAIQRTANFAISNPAREILWTVLEREEKYKAKNVIDIVVFRGADAMSSWLFELLRGAGLALSTISLATVPLLAGWLILSLGLGRAQERRAQGGAAQTVTATAPGAKGGVT